MVLFYMIITFVIIIPQCIHSDRSDKNIKKIQIGIKFFFFMDPILSNKNPTHINKTAVED